MKILVIISSLSKSKTENIDLIKHLFSDEMFDVYTHEVELPVIQNKDLNIDNYVLLSSLKYSFEFPNEKGIPTYKYVNNPVIVIRDTSTSDLTPETMKDKMLYALKYLDKNNLIFLCKWGDQCQKYITVDPNIKGSKLKKSINPSSNQCILFSPELRTYFISSDSFQYTDFKIFMNNLLEDTKIQACVFDPNLVNFDISYASSPDDFSKQNSHSSIKVEKKKENTTYNLILFFFIAIVIFLVAYALINIEN
jgi:hypothetical protein